MAGPDAIELHTPVRLHGKNLRTVARFTVHEGQSVPFTLSYHPAHHAPHFVVDSRQSLTRTEAFWRDWLEQLNFPNSNARWRDAVIRSLITLKLLTYQPTGAIVAAPTTSLPEVMGGSRNWDYRHCWLRDSALTMYAMLNAGFRKEASSWREWLLRAVSGHPGQLQIVYGVAGERHLRESSLPWLSGYGNSQPVRIGNAAYKQLQLDVYGEVMETLHAARVAQLPAISQAWELQKLMLQDLEKKWKDPDHGIWEVRGAPRIFTHSRAMAWMAFDRAISSATQFNFSAPLDRWRGIRDAIKKDILKNGVDSSGCFVQSYGSAGLDASLLQLAQMGLVKASDHRFKATVRAIERELKENGLIRRYNRSQTDDGLPGEESAFILCNFWLADAYALMGMRQRAEKVFEEMLGLRNDLGLLSEEFDPVNRCLLGNFPQAFSHIGLVNTAFNLVTSSGPARQRVKRTAPKFAPMPKRKRFARKS